MRYKVAKHKYKKEEIESAQLFFDNGDYITIDKKEIEEISLRLYDKLIWENDDLCAEVESGFLKLRILGKNKSEDMDSMVYNPDQYGANRKNYIINRLIKEGGLKYILFYGEDDWSRSVFVNAVANIEGDCIRLQFIPKSSTESYESKEHIVNLNEIEKSFIRSIELVFENCQGFTIYSDEILDIELNLKPELDWEGHDYSRVVEHGHITLKIDEEIDMREMYFLTKYTEKSSRKKLERRLLWEKKSTTHDICQLFVNYPYAGCGKTRREFLIIKDIKSKEKIAKLEKLEEKTGKECYIFEGGTCERQSDGSIRITFGRSTEA